MSDKKSRSNKQQIKVLIDFMTRHKNLATGELIGSQGAKIAHSLWQTVQKLLKEHGPDRSINQWKQTWKDLKKRAKAEKLAATRASKAEGNNGTILKVSAIGMKILNAIEHENNGICTDESHLGHENVSVEVKKEQSPEKAVSESSTSCPTSPQLSQSPDAEFPSEEPEPTAAHFQVEEYPHWQDNNNTILQSIASSLKERNSLLREQNRLLQEQNAHLAATNRLKMKKRYYHFRRLPFT